MLKHLIFSVQQRPYKGSAVISSSIKSFYYQKMSRPVTCMCTERIHVCVPSVYLIAVGCHVLLEIRRLLQLLVADGTPVFLVDVVHAC